MNVEELREQLEQAAGPEPRVTPEAREGVRRRVRRSRRRMGAVSTTAAVLLAVLVGAGVRAARNPTVEVRTVPATVAPAPPPDCLPGIRTVPKNEVPLDVFAWAHGAPVVGHGELWTIRSAIDVPATYVPGLHPVPSRWFLKFPWFTRPFGLPRISGRRLDGPGTFRSDVGRADDQRGAFVVSSLDFSGPGCWEVTARFDLVTISFRILVGNPPRPLATGTIVGSLHEVGGPAPGLDRIIGGEYRITRGLETWSGGSTGEGEFSVDLPAGTYSVTGTSPLYNGGRGQCFADGPVVVVRGRTTTVKVVCSIS
jgi:hypothetical protein